MSPYDPKFDLGNFPIEGYLTDFNKKTEFKLEVQVFNNPP